MEILLFFIFLILMFCSPVSDLINAKIEEIRARTRKIKEGDDNDNS